MHQGIEEHVRSYFGGHEIGSISWLPGPAALQFPRLHVLAVEPGPRTRLWSYVSEGAFETNDDPKLEFVVLADRPDTSLVELLTMAAYYHHTEGLDVGHTLPIGRPWLAGATCDHLLVSLPYPFGPDLEVVLGGSGHRRVLWLLPVTQAERDYKVREGVEALEQLFDSHAIAYWDSRRPSVVPGGTG